MTKMLLPPDFFPQDKCDQCDLPRGHTGLHRELVIDLQVTLLRKVRSNYHTHRTTFVTLTEAERLVIYEAAQQHGSGAHTRIMDALDQLA